MAGIDIVSDKHGWDYFDRIYCITLSGCDDRRLQAELEFQRVGLAGRVSFVTVQPHPNNSEEGIYESHILCLQRGLSEGAQTIVIFEDDVVFDRYSPQKLNNCVAFLNSEADWKVLFLGCLVKRSRKTPHPGIVAVIYRSLAHAYVVKKSFAQQLVNKRWQGIPFDAMLSRFQEGCFAVYPAFAFQSDAPSSNTNRLGLDRIRRLFGGLKRIQKANELTRRYAKPLVALHILSVLVIIGLIGFAIFF